MDRYPDQSMSRSFSKCVMLILSVFLLASVTGCFSGPGGKVTGPLPDRLSSIPGDAVKMTPDQDIYPPVLHLDEWQEPVPIPGPINSAGGEDSAFITPDGEDFYFFFTPDVQKSPELQVTDGVTGIYWSKSQGGGWSTPERVLLQDRHSLSLDGCHFVQGDMMWFCSARQGSRRELDIYTARLQDGTWTDWQNAGRLLNVEYGIGELHISRDGSEMYFHARKEGGAGGLDIWLCIKQDDAWQPPVNVVEVNSPGDEGWPFLSEDGRELWITRTFRGSPALFRSTRDGSGTWGTPELVISQFAGEATLDRKGNLYFTHHFYRESVMIEADIYAAYRRD